MAADTVFTRRPPPDAPLSARNGSAQKEMQQ